jgi:hypothetical protein
MQQECKDHRSTADDLHESKKMTKAFIADCLQLPTPAFEQDFLKEAAAAAKKGKVRQDVCCVDYPL